MMIDEFGILLLWNHIISNCEWFELSQMKLAIDLSPTLDVEKKKVDKVKGLIVCAMYVYYVFNWNFLSESSLH